MIRVEVEYTPRLTRGEQALLQLPNRLRNLPVVMKNQVAPATERMLKRHWTSKGAAFGHQWAPWAPETLRKRLRKGNTAKGILRDTDHLFKAAFRGVKAKGLVSVQGKNVLFKYSISDPKAIYHQVGTQYMPERLVVPYPLPDGFKKEVRTIIRDFIRGGRTS